MTARMDTARHYGVPVGPLLVVGGLSLASALELAVLRTFTRSAIHIPGLESLREPYRLLTTAGEFAYFVAITLLVPAFLALGLLLHRVRVPFRHVAMAGIVVFAVPASLAAASAVPRLALDLATVASITTLSAAVALAEPRARAAMPFACFATAFTTSGTYGAIPAGWELSTRVGQSTMLLNATELLGVAFALTLPLLLNSRVDRKAWVAGLTVGVLVFATFIGNGSTSRFLLLWNAGLSGVLPSVFYGAAAAAITITGVGLARDGRFLAAAGLLLLITGGIGLHSTYQSALVVVGLAAFCCAVGLPRSKEDLASALRARPSMETKAGPEPLRPSMNTPATSS